MLSSFVFAIVLVMLGYCVTAVPGQARDESDGKPVHGNTKLEIAWTVIPTIIVPSLAPPTRGSCSTTSRRRLQLNARRRHRAAVHGTFEYPRGGLDLERVSRAGRPPARANLTALDVLHSFWVQEWAAEATWVLIVEGNPTDVDNQMVDPRRGGGRSR